MSKWFSAPFFRSPIFPWLLYIGLVMFAVAVCALLVRFL